MTNKDDSKVLVTPVATFSWGEGIKHDGDEPFEVEQHQAAELRAHGLVAQEGDERKVKVRADAQNKMRSGRAAKDDA